MLGENHAFFESLGDIECDGLIAGLSEELC